MALFNFKYCLYVYMYIGLCFVCVVVSLVYGHSCLPLYYYVVMFVRLSLRIKGYLLTYLLTYKSCRTGVDTDEYATKHQQFRRPRYNAYCRRRGAEKRENVTE